MIGKRLCGMAAIFLAVMFLSLAGWRGAVQVAAAQAPAPAASPASQPPPKTATAQTYSQEQIDAGQTVFSQNCAFCHGRDAGGGETGPDLTRSTVVAADVRGDQIGPVVHGGRADKGMPSFNLSDQDLAAVVAFIHDQKTKADSEQGGRQHVTPEDLQTGNADAGKAFFNGAGKCATCHSPTGDLAGIAAKYQGLTLLERMLYPAAGRGVGPVATVTVTLPGGQTFTGKLAYKDEFTIALRDVAGRYRSWPTDQVKFTVDDPMQAHVDLLGKYTDAQMHDVLAYLQTLK
jgi:cytochrome c oxidase cbb3-type subunit III